LLRTMKCDVGCKSKQGDPVDIFACALHGECTMHKKRSEKTIEPCVICEDRTSLEIDLSISKPLLKYDEPKPTSVYVPTYPDVPSCKRMVLTIGTGEECGKLLSFTRPLMQAYAERIGASFLCLTDKTQAWPLLEKFRIGDVLPHCEELVFLDA